MKTRAEGPYTFLQYKNTAGWVAIVESPLGRRLEADNTSLSKISEVLDENGKVMLLRKCTLK